MSIKIFKLKSIKEITVDIYEITYTVKWLEKMHPWQFITFLLDNVWWRSYSILKQEKEEITLIIKKREINKWWRWGSKFLCEQKIWDELKWIWPSWHFLLKENTNNKLFIWTGTWFVPLYNMINYSLKNNINCKIKLIFWVRNIEDIFYLENLKQLKSQYNNFDFSIYISRDKDLHEFRLKHPENNIYSWYTTNFLTEKHIQQFNEIYICWAHTMINSTIEKLEKHGFKDKENIFYEKY